MLLDFSMLRIEDIIVGLRPMQIAMMELHGTPSALIVVAR